MDVLKKIAVWDGGAVGLELPRPGQGKSSVVMLRRLTPSAIARILRAVHLREGDVGSLVTLAMLKLRWAIVGVDSARPLSDQQTGEVVAFVKGIDHEYPTLGEIAGEAVYDALGSIDVEGILAVAEHRIHPDVVAPKLRESFDRIEKETEARDKAASALAESLRNAKAAAEDATEKNFGASPRPSGGGDATSAIVSAEPTAA